jgi:hypothetical protein
VQKTTTRDSQSRCRWDALTSTLPHRPHNLRIGYITAVVSKDCDTKIRFSTGVSAEPDHQLFSQHRNHGVDIIFTLGHREKTVCAGTLLAVPPPGDPERGPLARSRAGAIVRAAHGLHPVGNHRCRCAAELAGATGAREPDRGAPSSPNNKTRRRSRVVAPVALAPEPPKPERRGTGRGFPCGNSLHLFVQLQFARDQFRFARRERRSFCGPVLLHDHRVVAMVLAEAQALSAGAEETAVGSGIPAPQAPKAKQFSI